ncbi:MAG TPA: 3-methyl-2-oxobutanoate hydroxymethyltransferase [Verrucomicrobiales bacterium]|nr:3-methyl-2-oxobutanoate hydroxymethyltransferase [Verrucomicrobiales bacterium]
MTTWNPTVLDSLARLHAQGQPIASLTAYDYPTARLLDEAGVDLILVGDSLGMVVLGLPDTTGVTLEAMLHHTRACRRGVTRALLVADLPYQTYETPEQALTSARALLEAGADAVKLEGGAAISTQVEALARAGVPLVGHVGMLPQHIREEGGYKKKGRRSAEARLLKADARFLESQGALAIVLEGIVPDVAAAITKALSIPTIGIGSGDACSGQILVIHDLLGAFPWFRPPFAIPRADLASAITQAAQEFIADVRRGPGAC